MHLRKSLLLAVSLTCVFLEGCWSSKSVTYQIELEPEPLKEINHCFKADGFESFVVNVVTPMAHHERGTTAKHTIKVNDAVTLEFRAWKDSDSKVDFAVCGTKSSAKDKVGCGNAKIDLKNPSATCTPLTLTEKTIKTVKVTLNKTGDFSEITVRIKPTLLAGAAINKLVLGKDVFYVDGPKAQLQMYKGSYRGGFLVYSSEFDIPATGEITLTVAVPTKRLINYSLKTTFKPEKAKITVVPVSVADYLKTALTETLYAQTLDQLAAQETVFTELSWNITVGTKSTAFTQLVPPTGLTAQILYEADSDNVKRVFFTKTVSTITSAELKATTPLLREGTQTIQLKEVSKTSKAALRH